MKKMTLLITVALVVAMSACNDDDTDAPEPILLTEYVSAEAYLEEVGFSGSVLIRKGNTDLLRQGFGMADIANGVQNDPSLTYRIGSMTKAFTAMGIVSLKRDGLIDSYDQTISDFDPEYAHGDKITLRHLLTHYSGIPDYISPIEDAVNNQGQFFTPDDIYDILKESSAEDGLLFEPGTQWSYSNSNYLILGILIEELSGMNYHDYLQEKVFDPLGLANTSRGENIIAGQGFAKGYLGNTEVAPYQMQLAYSAGDLVSTIDDLEIWGDALLGSQFLTTAEKADVFAAPFGQDDFFTSGMGWFTISIEGTLFYNHGGNIDGFSSIIALLPESNSIIILLSNQQDWAPLNNTLETIMKNEF
ncbi:MAG: serine hydrolase domain-containing protein [Bacteroidota bacterium]